MKLKNLVQDISYQILQGSVDKEITELVYDSRKLTKNCVFVCICGTKRDSHDFVEEAVEKGAAAIVAEREVSVPDGVTLLLTKDTRVALANLAAAYFGYPARQLKTIGITGTKGKTTTVKLITEMLQTKRKAITCGNIGFPLSRAVIESKKSIKVVEVSSFMLEHIENFKPHVATITNIDQDHLARHKTMEEYSNLKKQIFKNQTCKDYAVVNFL